MPLLNIFLQFQVVSVAQGASGPSRPGSAEQAAFLYRKEDIIKEIWKLTVIWETGIHQSVQGVLTSLHVILKVRGFPALSLKVSISCMSVQQNLCVRGERVKAEGMEAT